MINAAKRIDDDAPQMFLGTIHVGYHELVETFGKPDTGDGYKTEAVWNVTLDPLVKVTIYNYKNSKSYDGKNPSIKSVREWSVDGTDADAIEWVKGALGQDTK